MSHQQYIQTKHPSIHPLNAFKRHPIYGTERNVSEYGAGPSSVQPCVGGVTVIECVRGWVASLIKGVF